ncbi:hypothetical protein [Legionella antarctica]|uniref:hypothetical protein n=1 Tax=Legionella antarctica TaxID=2708020 RepID=UPI001565A926|nr:hypothetical protein [Legionella antarctica]
MVERVESWKHEQSKLSDNGIHIIYHGDDVDFDVERISPSVIYICAHGFSDDHPLVVGNNVDFTKTEFLDIQRVSHRFNQDFGWVFNQIEAIHLYCCGSQSKNKKMAEELLTGLMRKDISIHSYAGHVTTPDSNGIRWSFSINQKVPVQDTESILLKQDTCEIPSRVGIKAETIERFLEEAKERRRYNFFARGKAARQEELYHRRIIITMQTNSTNPTPQSNDEITATPPCL